VIDSETRIVCTAVRAPELGTDLLIVPVFQGDDLADVPGLDGATRGEISRAQTSGEFCARLEELFFATVFDATWRPRRVMLAGSGRRDAFSHIRLRGLAAACGRAARQRRVDSVAWLMRGVPSDSRHVQAVAEGFTLARFDPGLYKTDAGPRGPSCIQVIVSRWSEQLEPAVARGHLLGHCCNLARTLVNEPANVLTPRVFAARASELGTESGIEVDILDEQAIAGLGMGLLLGVARGSAEPPRVIVLRYEPAGAPDGPMLGMVGKGVTFDGGGISVKRPGDLDLMKYDMAGGAAVICAMRALGVLKPTIRVVGVVPVVENMPGGSATKPGDVLRSASGKSVEVVNPDAEGRLILADALWYARTLGATHLVDMATLTGACIVALGALTSGLFGTPDRWVDAIRQIADREGEPAWPFPMFDEYADPLRSPIADLVNSAGRYAGAITAAMFLKEFTGGLPWAHFDIAGTAWSDDARPSRPAGPTGVGVRTLVSLALSEETWAHHSCSSAVQAHEQCLTGCARSL
jgi:leucyl aminopeptidase